MPIDFQQVRDLLAAIAQTDVVELELKSDDFELRVRKSETASASGSLPVELPVATIPSVVSKPASPTAPASPAPPVDTSHWVAITSPMVGTFYRSPAPDEAPFVEVGDRVRNGQTVCIIEAMKLMNDIESEVSGQVAEILVENGEPVEYGQALMRVQPD
ncbi:MAG: acetyl-CoA carboxylase biotin carboxyl carrier protein [Spirulinaceae cyanobacterium RM2_2_10]|nr:acetyl-CoA carboxylase biotin carboxyl carrier protein [Spirulinaceae cyanobacterium SM2_1_0]NJO20940.1 acetyl-CoA carboxylase biotin carboxyl carrier protein [Spirulinaceae cyanobacterium RM2_2_10]